MAKYEGFKNLCTGVQGLGIALSFVIGGVWAVHAFVAERTEDIAEARLEALKLEIGVSLDADLEVSELDTVEIGGKPRRCFLVSVMLRNRGTRTSTITLPEPSALTVARVEGFSIQGLLFSGFKSPGLYLVDSEGQGVAKTQTLEPGDADRLEYVMNISRPGLYLATFSAMVSEEVLMDWYAAGIDPDLPTRLATSRYFVVQ